MDSSDEATSPPRGRLDPWLALVGFLPLVAAAATRGLWAPDEPRRAEVARELFESGDLLVLRLCGQPYPDKPPLFYWLSGLTGWLSGWNELAMRLVPLAAVALTAWLIGRWARRSFGALEGWLAPALFLTTLMVTVEGHQLQIDPLLACCTTAALYVASGVGSGSSAESGGGRSRAWLLVGLLTGLGALAKGPVAWVEVGLPVIAWLVWERFAGTARSDPRLDHERLRSPWALSPAAVLLAVGPVAAWALAVSVREPVFAEELFWGQHAGRMVSGEHHGGPIWKSALRLPLLLLPWTALVLDGLRRAWRLRRDPDQRELVRLALWFGVLVLFFSLIPTKRDLYLLPAYPAAALLGARALAQDARARRWSPGLGWSVALTLGIVVVAGLAAGPVADRAGLDLGALAWRGPLVALPAALSLWLGRRPRREGSALGFVRVHLIGWSASILAAALLVIPLMDPLKSSEDLALWIAARPERPDSIPCWGVHPEGYRFYGGVPAVDLDGRDLQDLLAREGADFLALVRVDRWEDLEPSRREGMQVLHRAQVGGRDLYVLGAAPAAGS